MHTLDHEKKRPNTRSGYNAIQAIHVILPAYNEEESLPTLLERFSGHEECSRLKIWVINDGSSDKTGELASKQYGDLEIKVISHQKNLGLGQALQTGIQKVLSCGAVNDVVIVMDADDTHDVELIRMMLARIDEGAEIVIASRFVSGGDDRTAPQFRRLLSRGAAIVFNSFLPLTGIHDFTSGYRAYQIELLVKARKHWGERLIEEKGFACMVELLLKLRYWNPKIEEIPFVLRYDRKLGASKLKLTRTLIQYFKLAVRDRLVPAPVQVDLKIS